MTFTYNEKGQMLQVALDTLGDGGQLMDVASEPGSDIGVECVKAFVRQGVCES